MEKPTGYEEVKLTQEILDLIEKEVAKDVAPIKVEDPETAEFYEEVMREYRTLQYSFLKWLKEKENPQRILYAGSGFDIVPKLVLGEEKVVHTSLEEFGRGEQKYFPDLGEGIKIVADNEQLPFKDSAFDMVLFFGLPEGIYLNEIFEINRTLKGGGLIITSKSVIEEWDPSAWFTDFESVTVPHQFQASDISGAEFFIFRKP